VVVPRLLKVLNNTTKFTLEMHPSTSTLHDLGVSLTSAVDLEFSIKPALDKIAASDDPYGTAMAQAICIGLGQLAQYKDDPNARPATEQTWDSFLVTQVGVLLPNTLPFVIQGKLNQLNATASLATINPRLAATYYSECTR